ncbi:peroxidase family protein [Cyanobium sp. PCC 7001]|uniref:peroxidase family protein n=1 Tax=Cyanobium sp. PCC 7001 TaxID=180281 RepID=UPI0018DB1E9A|nr:peroxidase family protein [Cyanobium sp. PCC 7001]
MAAAATQNSLLEAPVPMPGQNVNAFGVPLGDDGQELGIENFGGGDTIEIRNVAPLPINAPYNSWLTLFGQGFDHGLDFINKGGNGNVFIPLDPSDSLFDAGADGIPGTADDGPNFMVVTRATRDFANGGATQNVTTPWIDMNQAYGSHASYQVFLRDYTVNSTFGSDGDPGFSPISGLQLNQEFGAVISTGNMLASTRTGSGLPTWADIKANAESMLGFVLTDDFVLSSPLLATDDYGRFIPGASGLPQVVVETAPGVFTLVEGNLTTPVDLSAIPGGGTVVRTGHAFLLDIAHPANPTFNPDGTVDPTSYDPALLNEHFIAGDGRVNENQGLTAFHTIFHNEHDRLVADYKRIALEAAASGDLSFINAWLRPGRQLASGDPVPGVDSDAWDGERLFQAARFMVEMQYQHGVFEEFGRFIDPNIALDSGFNVTLNPAITAEFAHAVYRFGHSMLTESVDRFGIDPVTGDWSNNSESLIAAFLNPVGFLQSLDAVGTTQDLTPEEAAAEVLRGMTRQQGNDIDEFVTPALRNNLVGLPLDLATINIARGNELGLPKLNAARAEFFSLTGGNPSLTPYSNWNDFRSHLKHDASIYNFVAAYGTHPTITSATTVEAKRAAAMDLVDYVHPDGPAFMNAQGGFAGQRAGLDNVHLWIGGLAEAPEAGVTMLGTTFAFVFEQQLQALQNADRLYYLRRLNGNLLTQIENNTFAAMAERALGGAITSLPGHIFSLPTYTLEVDAATQHTNLGLDGKADPVGGAVSSNLQEVYRTSQGDPNHSTISQIGFNVANVLRYNGLGHVVLGGGAEADLLQAGSGNDTVYGRGGNDVIFSGQGDDQVWGGEGNDFISDNFGLNFLRGEAGHDIVLSGSGAGLSFGGTGNDWLAAPLGGIGNEMFGETGNDFILASDAGGAGNGGDGDDWFEGTFSGPDKFVLDDGVGALLGASGLGRPGQAKGNDVSMSKDGDDFIDGDFGNDVFVEGSGVDTYNGGAGFDWVSGARNGTDPDPLVAPLSGADVHGLGIDLLGLAAGGIGNQFADATDGLVEALAGSNLNDILMGDDNLDLVGGNVFQDLNQDGVLNGLDFVLDSELVARGLKVDVNGPAGIPDGVINQFDSGVSFDWNGDGVVDVADLLPVVVNTNFDPTGAIPGNPLIGIPLAGVFQDTAADSRLFNLPLDQGGIAGLFADNVLPGNDFLQLIPTALIENTAINTRIPDVTIPAEALFAADIFLDPPGVITDANGDGVTNDEDQYFNAGNLLIGGGGADILFGKAGNDVLDGDAWLNTQIVWTAPAGHASGLPAGTQIRFADMAEINRHQLITTNTISPGDLSIVKELASTVSAGDVASFIGSPDEFLFEGWRRLYVNDAGVPIDADGLTAADVGFAGEIDYITDPFLGVPIGFPEDPNRPGQPLFLERGLDGVSLSLFDLGADGIAGTADDIFFDPGLDPVSLADDVPVGTTFIGADGLARAFPRTALFGADGVQIEYNFDPTTLLFTGVSGLTTTSFTDVGFPFPEGDDLTGDTRGAGDGFFSVLHHPTVAQAADPSRVALVGGVAPEQGMDFVRNIELLRFFTPNVLDPSLVDAAGNADPLFVQDGGSFFDIDTIALLTQFQTPGVAVGDSGAANLAQLLSSRNFNAGFAATGPQAPGAGIPNAVLTLANDTGGSGSDLLTSDATVLLNGRATGQRYEISPTGNPISNDWEELIPTGIPGIGEVILESDLRTRLPLVQGANTVHVRVATIPSTDPLAPRDPSQLGAPTSFTFNLDEVNPDAPLQVVGSAGGNDIFTGIEPGAVLQYSVDGVANWGTTPFPTGTNYFVRQTDLAGNVSTTRSVVGSLPVAPPMAPPMAPPAAPLPPSTPPGPVPVETAGNATLLPNNQFVANSKPNKVRTIKKLNKFMKRGTALGIEQVKKGKFDTVFVKGGKKTKYGLAHLNKNGKRLKGEMDKITGNHKRMGKWENKFGQDFNGDGVIGKLSKQMRKDALLSSAAPSLNSEIGAPITSVITPPPSPTTPIVDPVLSGVAAGTSLV